MTRRRRVRGLGLVFSTVAALTASPPLPAQAAKSGCTPEEIAPYLKPGNAAIEGTVSSKTSRSSKERTQADTVEIFARVPCIERWFATPASGVFDPSFRRVNYPEDAAFLSALRTVIVDDQGRFAVYGMAPGKYRVRVPWVVHKPIAFTVVSTGRFVDTDIELVDGQTKTLKLKP